MQFIWFLVSLTKRAQTWLSVFEQMHEELPLLQRLLNSVEWRPFPSPSLLLSSPPQTSQPNAHPRCSSSGFDEPESKSEKSEKGKASENKWKWGWYFYHVKETLVDSIILVTFFNRVAASLDRQHCLKVRVEMKVKSEKWIWKSENEKWQFSPETSG